MTKPNPTKEPRSWCWPFLHDWPKWSEPENVEDMKVGPIVLQFRACRRCNAVSARRVMAHNGV